MGLLDLFRPVWESENLSKSCEAVEKITDQYELAKIAIKASHYQIRKIAIEKLNEQYQELFVDIIKNDDNNDVRIAAIEKLDGRAEHQWFLRDIIKNEGIPSVLALCCKKYTGWNSGSYKDDNAVCDALRKKLTNQKLLADVAKNAKHRFVRSSAIEKLDEQHQVLFAEIAKNINEDEYVRKCAIKKLTDQTILINIVQDDNDNIEVRWRAIEQLDEQHQELFASIALFDKNLGAREIAVKKLIDEKLLKNIALQKKKNFEFPKITMETFSNEHILEMQERANASIRKIAVEKITDKQILSELLSNEITEYEAFLQCEKLQYKDLLKDFLNEEFLVKMISRGDDNELAWKLLADLEGERNCETLEKLSLRNLNHYSKHFKDYMPKLVNTTFLKYCFSKTSFKLNLLSASWDSNSFHLFIKACEDLSEARKKEIYKFYEIVDGVIYKSECELGKHDYVYVGRGREMGTYHDGDDWCWEDVDIYKCSRCGNVK